MDQNIQTLPVNALFVVSSIMLDNFVLNKFFVINKVFEITVMGDQLAKSGDNEHFLRFQESVGRPLV